MLNDKITSQKEEAVKKTYKSICRFCMQGDCSTIVHTENDVVSYVEGNPDCPANSGKLCARGNSAIMNLYNPYRVKAPLKRTNPEKGLDIDPGWEEISWEEALDTIAKKLDAVRKKDPRGLIALKGWGQRESILRVPFQKAFGTPNEVGTHGSLCTVHYATALVQANFPVTVADLEYCKYHITVGRSLGPNFGTSSGTRRFAKAMERGMELVVVDPRCSPEASKGRWVPIRPGTDLAFMLAFAHVMLHEIERYDEWFLKWRTNGPYLIDQEGFYLRDENTGKPMLYDSANSIAKAWDQDFEDIALEGSFKINGVEYNTALTRIREQMKDYTPEWAEKITTIPAGEIRKIAGDFVDNACIGSTIEIDGTVFPYRPVSIICERNTTNHRGGTWADLTTKIINLLVGAIEVPGSALGCGKRGPVLAPEETEGTVKPSHEAVAFPWKFPPDHIDAYEFYPNKHTGPHLMVNALLNPDEYYIEYDVEALMNVGANPMKGNAEPEKYLEAFSKIPFIFSISYHLDEMTVLSDIVLPEHSFLERVRAQIFWPQHQSVSGETASVKMVQGREPVPHLYDTRHVDDILIDLADRLNILHGKGGMNDFINRDVDPIITDDGLYLKNSFLLDLDKKYKIENIYDRQIKSWTGQEEQGLGFLLEQGMINEQDSARYSYNYYYMPDNSTRHPIYFHHMKATGMQLKENMERSGVERFPGVGSIDEVINQYQAIPGWIENAELNAEDKDTFDLYMISYRMPYFSSNVGDVLGNPWLAMVYEDSPYSMIILMNKKTGLTKNLKDNDEVVVESRYGKTKGRIRLSETIHPEVVGIPASHGIGTFNDNPLHKQGPHSNALLSVDEKSLDHVSAGQENAPRVRVYKEAGR